MSRLHVAQVGVAAALTVVVTACGGGPPVSPSLPPLPPLAQAVPAGATHGPSVNGSAVDCDRLLPAADLATAAGEPVQALGWNLNSCYWTTPTRTIQLVLQTGPDAHRWFTILQEPGDSAGMVGVTGYDFEAIEKVGSFGGYAPGRTALLHSPLTTAVAAPLVRQVLARL